MYIDSHVHLSKKDYNDIDEVINRAKQKKVAYLIVSCCSMNEIKEGLNLLNKYENIFLTIGLHPSEADIYNEQDICEIKSIIEKEPRIVAIGEIGLDYYYGKDNKKKQKELFIKQLNIAKEINLPVVIHTREATNETIEILKNYNLKGVIHCFSGSLETANIYIKMGYKLGIGGVLTFKNSNLKEVIKKLDLTNILLETDSPYLAPEPVRGSKNEPANIPYIAKNMSIIKEVDEKELGQITFQNTIDVFDLNRFL